MNTPATVTNPISLVNADKLPIRQQVIALYKNIITSDEAEAAQFTESLLKPYTIALKLERIAKRDAAKVATNKPPKDQQKSS